MKDDIPTTLSELSEDSTHRLVTDAEKSAWNAKSDFSGSYNDLTNKPTIPSIEGLATEEYVDSAVDSIPLANGSGTAGLIKTSSGVSSTEGYTACPVINGVPYYKQGTSTAGGTVQSDYEESDTTSGAYILNRPFYDNGTITESWSSDPLHPDVDTLSDITWGYMIELGEDYSG
jgi:hypothetical protein